MSNSKLPTSFWVIGVAALLWNLMGCAAYISDATMSAEALAALPDAERLLYETQPAWVTAAYGTAVWFGLAGCILLLLRKKWAITAFIISLVGAIVQQIHSFFMTNAMEVFGNLALILPLLILVIGIALIYYARQCDAKGWLS